MVPIVGIIVSPQGISEVTLLSPGADVEAAMRFMAQVAPALPALRDAATGGRGGPVSPTLRVGADQ